MPAENKVKESVLPHYIRMLQCMRETEIWHSKVTEVAEQNHRDPTKMAKKAHDDSVGNAKEEQQRAVEKAKKMHERTVKRAEEKRDRALEETEKRFDSTVQKAENDHNTTNKQADESHDNGIARIESQYENSMKSIRENYEKARDDLRTGMNLIREEGGFMTADWEDKSWREFLPTSGLRTSDVTRIGVLKEEGQWHGTEIPALAPIIGGKNLIIKASGDSKKRAVEALQSIMLRLLATVPPAKLRFVLMDPLGLGQNVSGFMHLADYDEDLVSERVSTEPSQIESRLEYLSNHMGKVIQKYLRNRYSTIEEYVADAGEFPEPYHILVIVDFPANFTEKATKKLISIAEKGPAYGVYILALFDKDQFLPQGFNIESLEKTANVVHRRGGSFFLRDIIFNESPLVLDRLPPVKLFNRIVQKVGEEAKQAKQATIPLDRIIKPETEPWSLVSQDGLVIPIGRKSAGGIQNLDLGQKNTGNVLVVGSMGSGRRTLIHTIVNGTSLLYPPDEVRLHLVSFGKGVEFNDYAIYGLPHARVLATKSEREFGLSVLNEVFEELKRRQKEMDDKRVESLSKYRKKTKKMIPRILLIVDEFQELFSRDDASAHRAIRLLDRLVRDGGASGVHVLLGSQSIDGTYSVTSTILDQMKVRIVLQCSEADSEIVLGEDHLVARTLTGPGEAIYDIKNGTVRENGHFKIASLSESLLKENLENVGELATSRKYVPGVSQAVFDGGSVPSITSNEVLVDMLGAKSWPRRKSDFCAWLGEPLVMRERHTSAHFCNNGRDNLLIVGQNEEAAGHVVISALMSIAAQLRPTDAKIYLIDLSSPESELMGSMFSTISDDLAETLPHEMKHVRRRHLEDVINEVAISLSERSGSGEGSSSQLEFLIIFGLNKARDLLQEKSTSDRVEDNDLNDKGQVSMSKQYAEILSRGPELGIFSITWCDTFANLTRILDPDSIRNFGMRVALQMDDEDSIGFVGSPLASKLGLHRALFCREEEGLLEKFRPYNFPPAEILREVAKTKRRKGR